MAPVVKYRQQVGKSFTVREVAGGWIFEWHNPVDDIVDRMIGSTWPPMKAPAESGTAVFVDKKKLAEKIKQFLGS